MRWLDHVRQRVLPFVNLEGDDKAGQCMLGVRGELKERDGAELISRAHPGYRGAHTGWYNWVNVRWAGYGVLPAHVRMVLEIPNLIEFAKKERAG